MKETQYDSISGQYAEMVKKDPQKQFVQYPSALHLLGDITGQMILDVGCGGGAFTRLLVNRGARVTAYDNSAGQIAQAKESSKSIFVDYLVADPMEFRRNEQFDQAVTVLVLHYADDTQHLRKFFSSTCEALRHGGQFVCILANPDLKQLDVPMYNRCFHKIGNNRMTVFFLDQDQTVVCSAEYSDFSRMDYERATITGGFSRFEWVPLHIENGGVEAMGENYWLGFEEDCPYIGFIAFKE
ncbi:MAG: class I SAM-dependent methyltransferase [Candidatus Falkowbacteria bacterium]